MARKTQSKEKLNFERPNPEYLRPTNPFPEKSGFISPYRLLLSSSTRHKPLAEQEILLKQEEAMKRGGTLRLYFKIHAPFEYENAMHT